MLWVGIKDGRRVVLKGLPDALRHHPDEKARLRKEYLLGLSVDHPGVVKVYGFTEYPQFGPVLEMEYIDGVTLGRYLQPDIRENKNTRNHAFPSLTERRRIAYEIADAVASIHEAGIVHRDLKPDNILITRKGGRVKIIDFGNGDSASHVIFKLARSTKQYGAPEMQDASKGNAACDVYSFGVILDELLPERKYRSLRKACKIPDPIQRPPMKEVARRLEREFSPLHHMLPGILSLSVFLLFIAVAILFLRKTEDGHDAGVLDIPYPVSDSAHINGETPSANAISDPASPEVIEATDLISANRKDSIADNVKLQEKSHPVSPEKKAKGSPEEIENYYMDEFNAVVTEIGPVPRDMQSDGEDVCINRDVLRGKRYDEALKISKNLTVDLKKAGVDSIVVSGYVRRFWNHYKRQVQKIDGYR
ncbi:MAG: serine/threonine protein kinase [Muribaculaceae bacterium]|nr:serine/threonine protein kinase [Muribaculaceae bacterium]